jgi:hypothetical protein
MSCAQKGLSDGVGAGGGGGAGGDIGVGVSAPVHVTIARACRQLVRSDAVRVVAARALQKARVARWCSVSVVYVQHATRALTFGPQLEASHNQPERVFVRHEPKQRVRHTAPVDRSHAPVVEIPQQLDVHELNILTHRRLCELCVQQIHLYPHELELDRGHVGFWHAVEVRHFFVRAQLGSERGEEVVSSDVNGACQTEQARGWVGGEGWSERGGGCVGRFSEHVRG